MSVSKTTNDGTVSVFTKEGVNVFKEEDVLITCKGKSIRIGVRDSHGRYQIPFCNNGDNGNRGVHPNKRKKHSDKPTVYMISHPPNKPSNGCTPYVVTQ